MPRKFMVLSALLALLLTGCITAEFRESPPSIVGKPPSIAPSPMIEPSAAPSVIPSEPPPPPPPAPKGVRLTVTEAAFVDPGGRYTCLIGSKWSNVIGVRCDYWNGSWGLAKPKGCEAGWDMILVLNNRVQAGCAGDTVNTLAHVSGDPEYVGWYRSGVDTTATVGEDSEPSAVLKPGDTLVAEPFECTRTARGYRCLDATTKAAFEIVDGKLKS